MPLTKEQKSDLESFINRLIEVKLQEQYATLAVKEAKAKLDNFIYNLAANPTK